MARNIYEVRMSVGGTLSRNVEEICRETDRVETVMRATLPGDPRRLRGLPAVGRSVSGHIAGTDPLEALMDKYGGDDGMAA